MSDKKPKILLVGGGTLGSVSPLLAVALEFPAEYLFVCSPHGPERKLIEANNIPLVTLRAGKWRRYFSWQNLADIFWFKISFWRSLGIIRKFKPDLILTAGSFVAVPVAFSGWFCRVPVVVHQQDILVGLANKIMAPLAKVITVTFPEQKNSFHNKNKIVVTGNPVRKIVASENPAKIILITGGGLGARGLNEFVKEFIPYLSSYYPVHHILGQENWDQRARQENYTAHQFVTSEMLDLMSRAELIISRAGMQTITEVARLSKALVLVPMPNSHQEQNAVFLAKHNAAYLVKQGQHQIMARYLEKLLNNNDLRNGLASNLHNLFPKQAIENYVEVIKKLLK
ncbi:MAG: UDP-N-acetylglucosamine--N-acetylmuramyl-(pentapeptide) pyrophosphoryl-undecaprenol N-acetylglucosamine transferase [Patescibacteria group bacterium]|jgi:UDP-N-acetylglucosamine--N-acetylmuramyl-(pentapeptide) pyrophosphoryl-undecaprenol N-acetylglucosamine transferase